MKLLVMVSAFFVAASVAVADDPTGIASEKFYAELRQFYNGIRITGTTTAAKEEQWKHVSDEFYAKYRPGRVVVWQAVVHDVTWKDGWAKIVWRDTAKQLQFPKGLRISGWYSFPIRCQESEILDLKRGDKMEIEAAIRWLPKQSFSTASPIAPYNPVIFCQQTVQGRLSGITGTFSARALRATVNGRVLMYEQALKPNAKGDDDE